jgi:hypothetical protein
MRSRPYLDLPDPQICCRVTGSPGQRMRMALGPQDLPRPFVILCCVGHAVIHILRAHALVKAVSNQAWSAQAQVAVTWEMVLSVIRIYQAIGLRHLSRTFSNLGCRSACFRVAVWAEMASLQVLCLPRDPTVVTIHWSLESERYTIDSGARMGPRMS